MVPSEVASLRAPDQLSPAWPAESIICVCVFLVALEGPAQASLQSAISSAGSLWEGHLTSLRLNAPLQNRNDHTHLRRVL